MNRRVALKSPQRLTGKRLTLTRWIDPFLARRRVRKSEQKVVSVLVLYLEIVYRIGEATNPGPGLLTLNAGGWDKAKRFLCRNIAEWQLEGLTDRPDVIFLQETWLTQSQIPRAKREAHEIGYHALFVPALKPNHKGRASGGLAVIS